MAYTPTLFMKTMVSILPLPALRDFAHAAALELTIPAYASMRDEAARIDAAHWLRTADLELKTRAKTV